MKTTATAVKHHRIMMLSILFLVLFPKMILVGAQDNAPPPPPPPDYSRFSPTMVIILIMFIGGFLFMAFYSIYVRHCSNSSAAANNNNVPPRARSRRTRGLDASVVETFPTFSYSEVKHHKIGKAALECAVCLNEFQDHERIRLIPKCDHVFHPDCIDPWFGSHVTCPVCRANLVPKPGDEPPVLIIPINTHVNDSDEISTMERSDSRNGLPMERSDSRNGEVVVQVDVNDHAREPKVKRNLSFDYFNRLQKSRSIKMFGLDKYRSRSTGHSLVQPGENLERYTLRLPAQVREEVMHRATLNRAKSCAIVLPREGSLRSGYMGDDESNQTGKLYQKIDQWSNRRAKSDQWSFFTRGNSMKLTILSGHGSTSKENGSKTPMKLPSFNCLEPKAMDEIGLFSDDQLVK